MKPYLKYLLIVPAAIFGPYFAVIPAANYLLYHNKVDTFLGISATKMDSPFCTTEFSKSDLSDSVTKRNMFLGKESTTYQDNNGDGVVDEIKVDPDIRLKRETDYPKFRGVFNRADSEFAEAKKRLEPLIEAFEKEREAKLASLMD